MVDETNYSQIDNHAYEGKRSIEKLFPEGKYRPFKSYCKVKNFTYVEDLDGFDYTQLLKIRGIGLGKIKEIEGRIKYNIPVKNDIDFLNNCFITKNQKLIKDIFYETKYKNLTDYCIEKNLIYATDFNNFDFSELLIINGMGTGKIKKLQELLLGDENENLGTFNYINDDYLKINIEALEFFGINNKEINHLKRSSVYTFGDLRNYKARDNHIIESINNISSIIEKPIMSTIEVFFIYISANKDYDIVLKRIDGQTLSQIGDEYCVEKERIRQREKRFVLRSEPIVSAFLESLKNEYGPYIKSEMIDRCFTNQEHQKVINFLMDKNQNCFYFDFAEIFILSENSFLIKDMLYSITQEAICEYANIDDVLEEIIPKARDLGYDWIDAEIYCNYLLRIGYKFYGSYVSKSKVSYGLLCAELIKKYFPDGFSFNDANMMNHLRELYKKEFNGRCIPDSDRALKARVVDNLMQRDKVTYISQEYLKVDPYLIEEIINYINNSDTNKIFLGVIYEQFKGKLQAYSNIDNKYFLRSALKYFYPGVYIWDTRDYLSKKIGEGITTSTADNIRKLIHAKGSAISKEDIKKELGLISDTIISNSLLNDIEVIQWEYGFYNVVSNLVISNQEKMQLNDIVFNESKKYGGYLSERLLYEAALDSMPDFLEKNKVKNAQNLFYIANIFCSKQFNFRRPHILSIYVNIKNIDVKSIMNKFLQIDRSFSYSHLVDLGEKLKWPPVTVASAIAEIKNSYIRVSDNDYIGEKFFLLEEEDKMGIIKFMNVQLENREYISINAIHEYEKLPDIGYAWNEFLLVSIIEKYNLGFKILYSSSNSRRFNRGIYVKNNCKFDSFDQLTASIMKRDNILSLSSSQMEAYLQKKGLVASRIPFEFYNSQYFNYNEDNDIFNLA